VRVARRLLAAVVSGATLAGACLAPAAHAAPRVTLNAALTPERLGHGTTIGFGFQITAPAGEVPLPVTEIDLRYPSGLGIAVSGLGLATCRVERLQAAGPRRCPANSIMGYGTVLAEIPLGPEIVQEATRVTIVRGPTQDGHIALLFNADGGDPISAQIVLPGLLLPTPPPYGGRINLDVPLVPSLPAGPDVSVVEMHATLGPEHVTYYERLRGRTVAYRPRGVLLPNSCPRGGFPFAAAFTFLDGAQTNAVTTVPCPRRRSSR
jgi:hypothetical protein